MQKRKFNLNTLYFSDRLQAELRGIGRHALTLVVAPMGYGKTTAVNWYLGECAQQPGTRVVRISMYSDSLPIFWQSVQCAFDRAGYDVLQGYDCPQDAATAAMLIDDLDDALTGPDACVLDAGCGEGTYTRAIYDALAAKGGCPQLLGADISAEAVRRAARQVPEGIFCAASTAHLPLAAESLDLIVNIFSPLMAEEFLRVLKPGGYLLRVVPMERHLFELKAAVYDRPYENPPAEPAVEGFRLLRTQTLRKTITLSSNEDVQALFLMTPYYYKTGAEDQQKLAAVPSLRVTTEFLIAVCQKP